MFRRLAAAILSAVILVSAAAAPALAYNPGYGQCQNISSFDFPTVPTGAGHFIQNNPGGPQGPMVLQGVQATFDATLAGHLCNQPDAYSDNGWKFGVKITEPGGKGFIMVGLTLCDKLSADPCDYWNRSTPSFFVYVTGCSGTNFDSFWDIQTNGHGDGDWAAHQYRLWFDMGAQTWHAYVDGEDVWSRYAGSGPIGAPYYCMNPAVGHNVIGGYQDLRDDLGDGWGDTNNYVTVRGMQRRDGAPYYWTYTGGSVGNNCAENGRPYPGPHYNVCIYDVTNGMKMVTVY